MSRGFSGGGSCAFPYVLSLPLILACAGSASAASQQDWDDCKQTRIGPHASPGCTRVLQDQAESASNRAIAHRNRGTAYSGMGARERALADFDEAIKLDPKFAAAYFGRGLARSWQDLDRKIADFSETIRLDPKFVEAWEYRGSTYCNNKEHDRAIAEYSESIKLNPQRPLPYQLRGAALHEEGLRSRHRRL